MPRPQAQSTATVAEPTRRPLKSHRQQTPQALQPE
jgi:hypothetical protein